MTITTPKRERGELRNLERRNAWQQSDLLRAREIIMELREKLNAATEFEETTP